MILLIIFVSLAYIFLILFLLYGFSRMEDFFGNDELPETRFSIIVSFRNEAANLPLLFETFLKLNYPAELFEILLVNDASEDTSESLCREFITANPGLNVSLLQNNRKSGSPKKDAIHTAIVKAKHEFILTTDADCTVPIMWLQTFNSKILETDAKMLAGPVTISPAGDFLTRFQEIDFFSLQGATMGGFGVDKPFMCNGANFCYHKQTFLKVNGFEGNDNIASGDDIFLLEKFKSGGYKTAFLKSRWAVVSTQAQPSWKSFFGQRIRWAAKTSAYKNFFGKITGLLVLGMNLILIIALAGVLLKKISPALLLFPFLLKFNIDFILIYNCSRFFVREKVLKNYFWCSLIYPFVSSSVAILSLISGYNWKGRRFRK